ncbi:hypothetical protein F8M41_020087 [Gigaspora margarita]|uniref:Uncharacterized protein n=1 Tax=Gigaspora margarita TaxID=4874 RepID=A0A8H4EU76_GIGMA|nr:hypothetical protein F8M41_020087 [Gigaspora margarita]
MERVLGIWLLAVFGSSLGVLSSVSSAFTYLLPSVLVQFKSPSFGLNLLLPLRNPVLPSASSAPHHFLLCKIFFVGSGNGLI